MTKQMMGEGINEFLLPPEADNSNLEKHAKQIHKKYGNNFKVKKNNKKEELQKEKPSADSSQTSARKNMQMSLK